MLSRVEILLLLMYTSPVIQGGRPAIVGSTRLQKLVFLATRESGDLERLCPEPYRFTAYDYGPYSNSLERDIEQLASRGLIDAPGLPPRPQSVHELTFEYLTGHLQRPAPNTMITLSDQGSRVVQQVLLRLRKDGFEPDLVIQGFERLHGRFTGLNLDELLRYVYATYPDYAVNSKRPDLVPGQDAENYDGDDGEDGDEP